MSFNKTLQRRYKKHLNTSPLLENLDQKEISRLLALSKEIEDVLSKTTRPADVLGFIFDAVVDELDKRIPAEKHQEDEQSMTGSDATGDGTLFNDQDVDAINIANKLSGGQAKGGFLGFGDPNKKIQQTYGNILKAVSTRLDKVAQRIKAT